MHGTTIACRLTPAIPSAVATIVVQGPAAVDVIRRITRLKVNRLGLGRVHFGWIPLTSDEQEFQSGGPPVRSDDMHHETAILRLDAEDGRPVQSGAAEQVVICRTEPETIELHCHGGKAVCHAILGLLADHGCQLVEPEAWPSQQACPLAAAAERDLLRASTDKVASVLLDQMNGALGNAVDEILRQIARADREAALSGLEDLQRWSNFGLHLISPWKVVFAGPPNVGKSSLMNAISGQLKSIVHHLPGTTRDWIEAEITFDGWPISLTDTAGFRAHADEVEGEGIRRARERVLAADLVAVVVDAQQGWGESHDTLLELDLPSWIVVWNKADLVRLPPEELRCRGEVVAASTVEPGGIDDLLYALRAVLIPCEPVVGQAVPFRSSQVARIRAAMRLILQGDALAATNELMHMKSSWIEERESP